METTLVFLIVINLFALRCESLYQYTVVYKEIKNKTAPIEYIIMNLILMITMLVVAVKLVMP